MGSEVIIGVAAAAVAAASAVAGGISSNHAANKANEVNLAEAERNRQFQLQMYQQQLLDQERQYKMYQSPQAVAQQLRAIGVNPASYFSGGKGVNSSLPTMPSGLPGSQANVQMAQGTGAIVSDAFKNASQGLVNLSSIYKTEKEREKLDADIQLLLAQKYGQDLQNNHQSIVNLVDSWKLPEQSKAELLRTINQAALFMSEKRYQDALTEYQGILSKIGEKDFDIKSAEAGNIALLISLQNGLIQQQTETERTRQTANKAQAFQSTTAGQLSQSQKTGQDYLNRISAIEVAVKEDPEYAEKLKDKLVSELLADKAVANNKETRSRLEELRGYSIINQRANSSVSRRLDNTLNWLRDVLGGIFHASFSN